MTMLRSTWLGDRSENACIPRSRARLAAQSLILAAGLILTGAGPARAQEAFMYAPISGTIESASLSIDFAGMSADEYVGATQVNSVQLWNPATMTSLDLSSAFFGGTAWPATPLINQAPDQTGVFSATIDPSFYGALLAGEVGLTALLTDTDDGWFAIDNIALNIVTTDGAFSYYYPQAPNGFGLGIPEGGNLPGPVQTVLSYTGTGFDEPISGKYIDVVTAIPEPGTVALLVFGAAAMLMPARKRLGTARSLILAGVVSAAFGAQAQIPNNAAAPVPGRAPVTEAVVGNKDEMGREYVPGEVMVVFKKGTRDQDRLDSLARAHVRLKQEMRLAGVHHGELHPGQTLRGALEALRNDPLVESASPNYIYYANDNTNLTTPPAGTLYQRQWHLNNNGRPTQRTPGPMHADPNGNGMYRHGRGHLLRFGCQRHGDSRRSSPLPGPCHFGTTCGGGRGRRH